MLYAGAHYQQRVKFIGGGAASIGRGAVRDKSLTARLDLTRGFGGVNSKTSVPDGYRGGTALTMAQSDGGMASRMVGGGLVSIANLNANGNLAVSLVGSSAISFANLAGGINISSMCSGSGIVSAADMRGKAKLTCTISIGAQPSAEDIAQAVWNFTLAGNTSPGNAAEAAKTALKRDEFLGLS